jgi:hypothetical protein
MKIILVGGVGHIIWLWAGQSRWLGQIITSAIGVGNDEDYDCYISFGLRSCIGAGI